MYYPRRLKIICLINVFLMMIFIIFHYGINFQFFIEIIFNDNSSYIHHYPEFVCPQNFRNLADWIYGWPETLFNERIENSRSKYKLLVPNLPHGSIIYVKVASLESFFTKIYPYLMNRFVLITGQGDEHAPGKYHHYLEKSQSKIIHWFGQNGDISGTRSKRFTHIPIGINCFEMAEAIRDVHRHYPKQLLPSLNHNDIDEPSHYTQLVDVTQSVLTNINNNNNNNQSDPILLLNFRPQTDPTGGRMKLWQQICSNQQNSFAMCYDKTDGVNISSLPTIYRRNRQYPLWLSPRGGGLDCHRTWEALYLDVIPIVWHSTLDTLYENLPVIVINDMSELNEEYLRSKLHEIARKKVKEPNVYAYEKLRNAYWRELILKKSRYGMNNNDAKRNRCWKAETIE
ncbi:hypothetical protein I4U23_007961 [Adineta vaga]|nr:hypothetical protein I4U23_007961 [Adineta vaga]